MKKFLPFVLLILLISSCSKSPEELKQDSDRFFNQALDYYERGYLSQAADLFEKVISIENKIGNEQRKANCYIYLGLINYQISDYIKAKNYYETAIKIFNALNDKRNQLLVLNNIAGIYSILGEYEEAIKIYTDIIGKSLIFADKESEAIASLNLGELYQELWDFEKSFEYFNKAYDSYEILGDIKGKIFTLNKIGELFIASKNFPNAMKSFDMAFEIINKTGVKYLNQEIYNNIGLIYFYEKQIPKAKEIFEIALNSVQTEETNQHILISLKNNLGDCEYQSQAYSKAIEHYKEALDLSERSFLKFLSPIIQLKIAKSYEKLFFINGQESDKKNAERFYQFAVNRFEENKDWKNLQKALTNFSSFYHRVGNQKKSNQNFKDATKLTLLVDLKPDDHLKSFAIKTDYDFAFLPSVVNQKNSEDAFRFLQKLKLQKSLEYFLRFRHFEFLEKNLSEKFENLRKEILALNTYQNIFTQEISLPSSQRIKEKVKIAAKKSEEAEDNIKEILNSLYSNYPALEYILDNKSIKEIIKDNRQIFVELFPAEQNLICFLASSKGLFVKNIKSDEENLSFNLQILLQNLDEFSLDDLKNFSLINFSHIADELVDFISSVNIEAKEVNFLLNGTELDFLQHLFYSKKRNQFISEIFNTAYSLFVLKNSSESNLESIGLLKNGSLINSKENKLETTSLSVSKPEQKKPEIGRRIRIGFSDEIKPNVKTPDDATPKKFDFVISLDELIFNSASPELTYFESQQRFYLSNFLKSQPKFFLIKSIKFNEQKSLILFFSQFYFDGIDWIIFPLTKKAQEIPDNFLYNYAKRVENKNLKIASKEFYNSLKNELEKKSISELQWIKFIN